MSRNINIRNYALIFVLFLICAASYYYFLSKPINKSAVTDKIQKHLHQRHKIVSDHFQLFEEMLLDSTMILNKKFLVEEFAGTYEKEGLTYLIYRDDSILFWTSNEVAFDNFSIEDFRTSGLTHLADGWYEMVNQEFSEYFIVALLLIKADYKYQNEYLTNEFFGLGGLPKNTEIVKENTDYQIHGYNKEVLLGLNIPDKKEVDENELLILFGIFLAALLFFIAFIYAVYRWVPYFEKKPVLFITSFILDLLIIRALIFYLKIPEILFESKLFGPFYFASSEFLPSLGDLFLHSIFILVIAFVFFRHFSVYCKPGTNSFIKWPLAIFLVLVVFLGYNLFQAVFEDLLINSDISFNLNNILTLTPLSFMGFGIICLFLISYLLFSVKILNQVFALFESSANIFLLLGLSFVVLVLFGIIYRDIFTVNALVLYTFIILFFLFRIKSEKKQIITLSAASVYLLLFSLLVTINLHTLNEAKEKEKRKLLAIKLTTERDQITEYNFVGLINQMTRDEKIKELLKNSVNDYSIEDSIVEYLNSKYLTAYWSRYDYQITICHKEKELNVKPADFIINCHQYFENLIKDIGRATLSKGLYYLDYEIGSNNYIAELQYNFYEEDSMLSPIKVFVEMIPKNFPKGLGYPELLVNKEFNIQSDLSDYSYAFYKNGELIKNVGKFFYSIDLSHYGSFSKQMSFFNRTDNNHLFYQINQDEALILSRKNLSWLELIAPFSYLYLIFGITAILIYWIVKQPFNFRKIYFSFRDRLQLSMISILIFSFLVIGLGTLFYVKWLNTNKNKDILSEKTHSILKELEHKLANEEALDGEITFYLSELLIKFSNVFFTDINVYGLNGQLLASSRPQIFEEGLISTKINTNAFFVLTDLKRSLFIHEEKIGNYNFYSAYVPFRNNQNKLIAYLNLPYFAKQDELKNEISTFLIAFVNIYIILITIAVIIALIISNYISLPMRLIMANIRKVQLGKTNEKIDWKREDEIGELIKEYNRMIDELSASASLLAKSERESAWREMAKQVAHEIKNPLTPMRLSVQYLKKAWDEKSDRWEDRLDKFTNTLIEQIDSLSSIASAFSDFAKMPKTRTERVNLVDIISSTLDLYKQKENLSIKLYVDEHVDFIVLADKDQLLRVFNNLIKNAEQAIGNKQLGNVDIHLRRNESSCLISISDNGHGISEEQSKQIFSPNFTTKSGGMGLGLVIVKNIVENSGGKIWFESKVNKGTTFFIQIPLLKGGDF